MRRETPVPAVRQRRLIRSRVVSQIPFDQVLHCLVLPLRLLTQRPSGDQPSHLNVDPLRHPPIRHVCRPANLPSLISKPHPPNYSSSIQSHESPPFVWPCFVLVSR